VMSASVGLSAHVSPKPYGQSSLYISRFIFFKIFLTCNANNLVLDVFTATDVLKQHGLSVCLPVCLSVHVVHSLVCLTKMAESIDMALGL